MTKLSTIPLNKLTAWDGNVRKTGRDEGIEELAASIASHGLLQSLVVKPGKRGKYAVIAGQRRLLALQSLAKAGRVDKDHGIDCRIADGDIDPAEISLAENVVRVAMHPADQFEAFAILIGGGASIADVSARFGVSESLVARRLKLGRLSPVILAAYRAGDIGLEEAQAFALSDDHTAQERVFEQLGDWQCQPRAIRAALTEGEIPATDRRVRFVGLDAYEAAGGAIRRDLFDAQDGGYVQDIALLDRLATEKLQAVADELRGEGWKWIECALDFDYEAQSHFGRVHAERVPLSGDDEAALESLTGEYDDLAEQAEADPEDAELGDRLQAISDRIDAIQAKGHAFSPEALTTAGVIVTLGYNGDIDIRRGLVRPEDARVAKASGKTASGGKPEGVILSAKLTEDLTAQKTAAIGAELAHQPDVALAAMVHALTLGTMYQYASDRSCLQVRVTLPRIREAINDHETASGLAALDRDRADWAHRLPENPAELWAWCLTQPSCTLLDLLAFVAGNLVDAVRRNHDRDGNTRIGHGNALARALQMDMAGAFTPTAANYFGRVNRDAILAALAEAKGASPAPSWAKMKKAELAALAERQVAGTGWLPAPLSIAEVASVRRSMRTSCPAAPRASLHTASHRSLIHSTAFGPGRPALMRSRVESDRRSTRRPVPISRSWTSI
jgi:ParB family chromosome partitioning protein